MMFTAQWAPFHSELHYACSELAAGGIVTSLVAMLNNGEVQGQVYAAGALTRMAADPVIQEQIVAAGAIPHLIAIMKDNIGAAPTAAGLQPHLYLEMLYSETGHIAKKTAPRDHLGEVTQSCCSCLLGN